MAAVIGEKDEALARKFEAAWSVFAQTCGQYLAPEPTYQAWFAHYLISQFGIDRVAREPIIKKEHFGDSPWKARVLGNHVRLDAVVTREPGVRLPHYANRLLRAKDGTGLQILKDLAVISELKVAATQGAGMDHTEVARDIYKMSMLLDEFERQHPGAPMPLAYVCILDNHPRRAYDWAHLQRRLTDVPPDPRVRILGEQYAPVTARPVLPATP
ncbi:hypothetical protein N866_11980 [Actinotalea ferrariae CF5-4]|uniref:Uncharacterized protein n=1 Tax=Actinotalea ferrariae CF5-4 TaxID=948458 RepID=A0A021VSQ2_9CELL|nr:hypothetical protein [Actinotalea ferrariae]EYR62092.1 hypothetical protein N866_11980 [Actinotalea ferrariae CF5-4]